MSVLFKATVSDSQKPSMSDRTKKKISSQNEIGHMPEEHTAMPEEHTAYGPLCNSDLL